MMFNVIVVPWNVFAAMKGLNCTLHFVTFWALLSFTCDWHQLVLHMSKAQCCLAKVKTLGAFLTSASLDVASICGQVASNQMLWWTNGRTAKQTQVNGQKNNVD